MSIETLSIRDLRNIESAVLSPEQGINIITGKNASGKTTLLEAIYLQFLAKSFRSNRTESIIRFDQECLQVVSNLDTNKTIGIEKSRTSTKIRYSGTKIASTAQLARIQPVVLITPESHQIVQGGPKERRSLLDWLLFHVEHDYFKSWKNYNRVLKQRNTLLKKKSSKKELAVWDEKLVQTGTLLDKKRKKTVEELLEQLEKKTRQFSGISVALDYENGWGEEELADVIKKEKEKDRITGYTRKGPHRAEVVIKTQGRSASQILSRGQTKILSLALEMAKISLLEKKTGKKTIILFDDLPAELDKENKEKITNMLLSMKTQQFITAINNEDLPTELRAEAGMFHVEQGKVMRVL